MDEKAPLVASVLAHATHGRLHDYLPSLFFVSVTSMKTTRLDGEPEATSLQDLLDPVFLESHAGFMQSQGFPALARRSRDLAALVREGTAPRTRPK